MKDRNTETRSQVQLKRLSVVAILAWSEVDLQSQADCSIRTHACVGPVLVNYLNVTWHLVRWSTNWWAQCRFHCGDGRRSKGHKTAIFSCLPTVYSGLVYLGYFEKYYVRILQFYANFQLSNANVHLAFGELLAHFVLFLYILASTGNERKLRIIIVLN